MADKQKPVIDEIASVATDFDIFQGFMEQIANPDDVLRLECGGDISLYDHIGRDSRVSSNLGTRARAVVGKEWTITPFSQEAIDIKVAEYVEKVFLGFPFDRARRSILRGGTLKGFALSEIMWDTSEGDTFIADMIYRHQRRFTFDTSGNILLKTIDNPMGMNVSIRDGLLLKKFQHVAFGDEVETPYGVGLGRELYWPWWFKKNGIKFWMMFCDKFAGPTVVGEYESGASPDDQDKLLSAAQAVHTNSSIIHPKGMSLSLLEAARSGSITAYNDLVNFMNDEMTISILGQTATTTGTPGKLGNEQAQEKVKDDLVKADADSLCEAFNARETGVIRWLVDYQFPGLGRYPQMWVDCQEEEDKKTLAERDEKLSVSMEKSGLKLSKSYYIRTHGLEEGDVEIITPQPPLSGGIKKPSPDKGSGEGLAFAEPAATVVDASDLLTDHLAQQAAIKTDQWLNQLRALTMNATSLEDLRDTIVEQFGSMDTAELGNIIAQAMMLGDMSGRLDVAQKQ
ncbi:MAG: DUF935 family protein [Desulfuromonadaceae bacterium]|nr:DUF935 family protein [Desulfuromonadaceae bacterium]MDD2855334.1 DUF935 family protein [Desulfuromonadaceae bacterium]